MVWSRNGGKWWSGFWNTDLLRYLDYQSVKAMLSDFGIKPF
jgi:hypothetical protein